MSDFPPGRKPSTTQSGPVNETEQGANKNEKGSEKDSNIKTKKESKLPPVPKPEGAASDDDDAEPEELEELPERPTWNNQMEFLMSCIATSVGLGNIWRFPFIAYENGGGAFLIPYIIVLMLVGRPMYYLECVMGQFSTKNSIKVWAMAPALKGIGYTQSLGCGFILSYYVSIVALCVYYLVMSLQPKLPWSYCWPEWEQYNCVASGQSVNMSDSKTINATSSAELFFIRKVLRQVDLKTGIDDGIGFPLWDLTLCLFVSWLIIFLIIARGVKSSGKASYFLALFPYSVMLILLVRSITLPGASNGILFFLTPQWGKLIELNVWYAAVTQVFFSLSVCIGPIIMFSSYNDFRHNIYRDAMIVTTLDTATSLMSGITIFGILGNLAYQLKYPNIDSIIGGGGAGLAFISYPDAIAQSPASQIFAILFFLMMTVLGVGSAVALHSTINTVLMDAFPRVRTMYMSAFSCFVGFLLGLVYVTPGGQLILALIDYYGGTFLVLFGAISQMIGVFYIYGLENICLDIEFMLRIKTSIYWRLCWGIITPLLMISVFFYALANFEAVVYNDYVYPALAYVSGYGLLLFGVLVVPFFMIIKLFKSRTGNFKKTLELAFLPQDDWGPRIDVHFEKWARFKARATRHRRRMKPTRLQHLINILIGRYRWKKKKSHKQKKKT